MPSVIALNASPSRPDIILSAAELLQVAGAEVSWEQACHQAEWQWSEKLPSVISEKRRQGASALALSIYPIVSASGVMFGHSEE